MASFVSNIAFEGSHAIIDLTGFGKITNAGVTVPGICYTIDNLFNKNIMVQIKSKGESPDEFFIWTLAYHSFGENNFISLAAEGSTQILETTISDIVKLKGLV